VSLTALTAPAALAAPAAARPAGIPRHPTVYVANRGSHSVSPISPVTSRSGPLIQVGRGPQTIAITPNYARAYVANDTSDTVTPVVTATDKALTPIPVGRFPDAIAISPDGKMAYVANGPYGPVGTITPIVLSTGTPQKPITVGREPLALAITPDGKTLYVLNAESRTVTPVVTATNTALTPIPVAADLHALVMSPDGKTVYVEGPQDLIMPISTATNTAGKPIPGTTGDGQFAMAITPNGKTLVAASFSQATVTLIRLATGHVSKPIPLGHIAYQVAVTPDSALAYAATGNGAVTPIRLADSRALPAISTGPRGLGDFAIAITPDGTMAYTANYTSGTSTAIRIPADRVVHTARVGTLPGAVQIAPSLESVCQPC
jgi:YVTN family beta-propeller protein